MPEPADTTTAGGPAATEAGPAIPAIPEGPPRRGSAIVRAGLLSMLALVALGLTRVLHGALVSRNTDFQTYSLVGTLITTATTAGLFLPGGLSSAASKFIPYQLARGNPDGALAVYRLLRRFGYFSGLVLGVLVAVGTGPVLHPSPAEAIAGGLLTLAFAVYSVEKAALYGFGRVPVYVRLELTGSGLAVVTTILVIAVGSRAYLVPLMLGYTVLAAGAWWTLRARGTHVLRRPGQLRATADRDWAAVPAVDRREIAGYVGLASIGGLAGFGFLQLLPLLAHLVTSDAQVSYFLAALTLVAPLYFLPRALSLALFPALAHAHGSGDLDAVRTHTDLSTRALLVLLAPVFAVGILIAPELLVIFGGRDYAGGTAVFQVLQVATYLAVSQVAAVNALSSGTRRQVRIPVWATVSGCLLGLAFVVPLGHAFGAAGLGGANLIAVSLGAAVPIVAVWRRYEMGWTGPVIRSLSVVFGAWAVGAVLWAWAGQRSDRVLVDLVGALAAGALALVILRRDIVAIARTARPKRPSAPDPMGTLVA